MIQNYEKSEIENNKPMKTYYACVFIIKKLFGLVPTIEINSSRRPEDIVMLKK